MKVKPYPSQSIKAMDDSLIGDLSADDALTQMFAEIEEADKWAMLNAALMELPALKAQLITWHYLEGKTLQEIAELSNCSLGTVKSRISRAVNELKLRIHRNL